MKRILYAVTGHGFGHATRALVIARLLKQRYPQIHVALSSAVDADAIRRFVPDFDRHFDLRHHDYEPGLIQKNCFEVDQAATRERYLALNRQLPDRIDRETRYLERGKFDAVISDVAAIPLAAAARLGLPSVVIGNFTWDWMLEPLLDDCTELSNYHSSLREDYGSAALYLRLPFHATEHPFRQVEDAPLVGRQSALAREEILSRAGIADDRERPLVLVAVGGWSSAGLSDITIDGCSDYRFLVAGDIPVTSRQAELYRLPFSLGGGLKFPDLVRIADIGVVKPGYGTCSEFVLNRGAMVGIERRNMREAEVMDHAVSEYIPFSHLSLENFLSGRWADSLAQVRDQPVPEYPDQARELTRLLERIVEVIGLPGVVASERAF